MKLIQSDKKAYGLNLKGLLLAPFTGHTFVAVLLYRIASFYARHGIKVLPNMIKYKAMRKFGCEISPYAKIGEGFKILHSVGIVIGHQVIAGDNLELFQNVTIGSNRKLRNGREMPIIGDNVSIYAGACVVGAIKIGNNVKIGANTYVDFDVPDGAFVHGEKGKIVIY